MSDWEFDPFAPRRRPEAVAEAMAAPAPVPTPPALPAPPAASDDPLFPPPAQPAARARRRRNSAPVPETVDPAAANAVADDPLFPPSAQPAARARPRRATAPATGEAATAPDIADRVAGGASQAASPDLMPAHAAPGPGNGQPAARPPGYRLSVKEMAPDERPRERLKLRGPQSLSDGDLLAILLNTGIVGETVTDVAQRLLADHGGIRGLLRMETEELARVRGIGDAKAVRLKAALEIGRRLAALGAEARPKITSPDDVATLLQVEMAALEQEQLRVVLLDTKHQVIAIRTVVQGSVNQAQVRVAEVFRDAVRQNAVALVAAHNHPSGDPTPSAADVSLTLELAQAGKLLDVELLDHLILGQGRWVSLRRLGLGFPAP